MIRNTFLHIQGIGSITENRLWSSGIESWDDIFRTGTVSLSPKRREHLKGQIRESQLHLQDNNPGYFANRLPSNQLWRIFPKFKDSIAYLDIETTGLESWLHHITTIALYDGESIFHYVRDQNLDDFKEDIKKYHTVVTYNGKCFDIPFIEYEMGIPMKQVHIDLRYLLASLGFKGGLKGCEIQAGIDRGDLSDIDGYFAVLLWNDYQRNKNQKALETLLAYNIHDVVNLEELMVLSYNLKLKDTPFFHTHQLSSPTQPDIPFKADRGTIERIKSKSYGATTGYYAWGELDMLPEEILTI